MPALKPVSTGAEIKFATNPRRRTEATISRTPVRAVSVAVAVISLAGVSVRHGDAQLCGGEDRQGRRRADAQNPRRAQKGIDDHRNKGRVEPDADRQASDRRIGHGFRQDDGRRRQARDHVETQPAVGLARWAVHAVGWLHVTLPVLAAQQALAADRDAEEHGAGNSGWVATRPRGSQR